MINCEREVFLMITLEHVTKQYAGGKTAVNDLTLHIPAGRVFGFLGPNGAGKTTTISMITGILAPTEGSITVCGHDMKTEPIACKQSLGYVPDAHELFDRLTGLEYLRFIADMYNVPADERTALIEKYSVMFGLTDALSSPVKTYSRGMKQKLTIIGVLIHQPKVWILDEPMVGLDPHAAHVLKEEMRAHADRGNAVFFSTHVLEVAEKLCDELAIIDDGKLVAQGTLEQLRSGHSGDSLEQLFLRLTEGGADA